LATCRQQVDTLFIIHSCLQMNFKVLYRRTHLNCTVELFQFRFLQKI